MQTIFFIAAFFILTAAENDISTMIDASPICMEYADCIHKAQAKLEECYVLENNTEITNGKKGHCTEVKRIHLEVRSIHDLIFTNLEACVRKEAENSTDLSQKKHERCQSILKKNAKRASIEPQKRKSKKEKNSLKAAAKTCNKEARRLKSQCTRLAKCCSAAKLCHKNANKSELETKKQALKEATKECASESSKKTTKKNGKKSGEDKEREGKKSRGDNRKSGGLKKSLENSASKKKESPIGGKKLKAALDDMPHS